MSDAALPLPRVLSIDPIARGFGYAVLEGPDVLVDWGICTVGSSDLLAAVHRVQELIRLYAPDVIVAEDCDDVGSRRRDRARRLIAEIGKLASGDLEARLIPASTLRTLFGSQAPATKSEIAAAIANQLGDLAARLPPPRRPWMTEDKRMAIFDAAGLALAFYVSDRTADSGEPLFQMKAAG
jgi:hypothetical protein